MLKLYTLLINIIIILTGSIILFLGIKKLKIKKRGIFATGLIIFLAFAGCKNNSKAQNTEINIKKEIEINNLIKTSEWIEFKKTILKILDKEYDFFPEKKEIDKLNEELKQSIDKVFQKTDKDSIEIEILNDLCLNKIIITENAPRKMVMHTIPPDSIIELTFSSINKSFYSLNQLKQNKILNQKQYDDAVEILMQEIIDFAKINFIYKNYFSSPAMFYDGMTFSKETKDLLKYALDDMEKNYNKTKEELKINSDKSKLEELEKKYNETKDKINKTDSVKNNMRILIQDIVR